MDAHDRETGELRDQHAPGLPDAQPTKPSARLPAALDLRWPMLLRLGLAGVSEAGVDRLIALRRRFGTCHPAIDGFEPDPRHEFARWMIQQGQLRE